jgi:diaminohydroxyphosphoribosylaminopyrimidine deaminase/5-amino-6-(5-phosphoribosylamino)uracil reductase
MATELELAAMRRAIAISARGVGTTSPNPAVGCVILDGTGQPVGEGYHRRKGEAHAEVNALTAAGSDAEGGTAVVTLEPCNHYGLTPPCHLALIDAGIRRVVVALLDPTSRGEGGVTALRAEGVSVEVGVLENEALLVLGPWLDSLQSGRPVVTWLYALSSQADTVGVASEAYPSASSDVETISLAYDVVLHEDGALTEGVPGGHAWTPPAGNVDPDLDSTELLKWISSLGARTVLLNGSRKLAAPFLEAGLVQSVVCYLPFRPPSARPGEAPVQVVPAGYHLREVARANDWVRIKADRA